jgi:hypothetical protein
MTNLSLFTEKLEEEIQSNTAFGSIKGISKFSSVLNTRSQTVIRKKNITKPYQFFGVWIAQNLNEFDHLPLYIKLAKYQDKGLLEKAVSYIKDYPDAKSKHKLFLWYLKGKMKKMPQQPKKIKKVNPQQVLI